jgi:hypothetical protein
MANEAASPMPVFPELAIVLGALALGHGRMVVTSIRASLQSMGARYGVANVKFAGNETLRQR